VLVLLLLWAVERDDFVRTFGHSHTQPLIIDCFPTDKWILSGWQEKHGRLDREFFSQCRLDQSLELMDKNFKKRCMFVTLEVMSEICKAFGQWPVNTTRLMSDVMTDSDEAFVWWTVAVCEEEWNKQVEARANRTAEEVEGEQQEENREEQELQQRLIEAADSNDGDVLPPPKKKSRRGGGKHKGKHKSIVERPLFAKHLSTITRARMEVGHLGGSTWDEVVMEKAILAREQRKDTSSSDESTTSAPAEPACEGMDLLKVVRHRRSQVVLCIVQTDTQTGH